MRHAGDMADCLYSLFMQGNWIKEEGASEVSRLLEHNTSITSLDLRVREGRRVAMRHGGGIEEVKCLLSRQGNAIREGGARAVAQALELNSSITSLDLGVR